jgi:hypothetical protein
MPLKYAAYRTARASGPIFPDRIYIESTNHCDLKCIMCPTGLGVIARPKGYMDMGLYRRRSPARAAIVRSSFYTRVQDSDRSCHRASGVHGVPVTA